MVFGMKTFSEKCIEDKGERYDYDMRSANMALEYWHAEAERLRAALTEILRLHDASDEGDYATLAVIVHEAQKALGPANG